MTTDAVLSHVPHPAKPKRTARQRLKAWRTPLLLTGIILGGLLVRVLLSSAEGNGFDIGVNQGWARSAVQLGLAHSYSEQLDGNMLPNYPAFSLMIFAAMGHLYKATWSPEMDPGSPVFDYFIRFPALLADLLTVLLMFFLIRKWKGSGAGLIAAALMAFHPVSIYNSAIWGQTDAIFTFFVAAGLAAFVWRWRIFGAVGAWLGVFCKLQAVAVGPLFALLYLRSGWRSILKAAVATTVVIILVLTPYAIGGNLKGALNVYVDLVGYYPIVTSAAYNFWWMLLGDAGGTTNDTTLLFNVISYRDAGLLIMAFFYAATFWVLRRRLDPREPYDRLMPAAFYAAALSCFAFFMFNTQMHERYLYAFIVFGLPLVFHSRRAALVYWLTCLFHLLNLMGWLPFSAVDRALYATFPAFDGFIAGAHVVLFGYWFALAFTLAKELPKPKKALRRRILEWAHARLDRVLRKAPKAA